MTWLVIFVVIWIVGVWVIGYLIDDDNIDMGAVCLWPVVVPLGILFFVICCLFMWPTLLRRRGN